MPLSRTGPGPPQLSTPRAPANSAGARATRSHELSDFCTASSAAQTRAQGTDRLPRAALTRVRDLRPSTRAPHTSTGTSLSVSEATQRWFCRHCPIAWAGCGSSRPTRAADDEALIGGDLYAATRRGNDARLLIRDVRGKGMTDISDASVTMGSFRDAAHRSAALPELAVTLEESICRHLTEHAPQPEADELYEQFVTFLMLDIPDEDPVAQMINCGHTPARAKGKDRRLVACGPT
ncbi:SpoIIE family protein phosphatase [Streptomyces caniferus]|uniref:SpoIIE family protein phosphatase n=1 Tax=Streptomyces caniferus TaxID=285557 RepID=UPI00345390E4